MVACYLKPIEGSNKRFLVYSFYKDSNNTLLTDDDVWNGADITVYGKITYFSPNSQPETSSATLIANHNEPVSRSQIIETTFEEAFEIGKQLESGETSWNLYKFIAYVVYKENGNFFLAATDVSSSANKYDGDTMIELYGLTSEFKEKCTKGAKISIILELKNYHGIVENSGMLCDIEVIQAGTAW